MLKNPPVSARDTRDMSSILKKEMATHSSILAWKTPWTEEQRGPWGHKGLETSEQLSMHATHPVPTKEKRSKTAKND